MARFALFALALVAIAASASAKSWFSAGSVQDQLIVTYSIIPDPFKTFSFLSIPRTLEAALKANYLYSDYRSEDKTTAYCLRADYRVCALYNQQGSVAGIRVAVDKWELDKSKAPNVDVASIPEWESTDIGLDNVYALTAFFQSKEELLAGGRVIKAGDLTAPNGIYILQTSANGTETGRLHVSTAQSEAEDSGFTEQACFFGMGKHYFQELRKDGSCDAHRPYFLLYGPKTQELNGFGISMFGKAPTSVRSWFEHPPAVVTKVIAPNSPECLVDYAKTYGMFTLHVYFVSNPYYTTC